MEKERITMSDMIIQTINDNLLSAEEEVEIMDVLRGRGEEREKKRMSRCLAGVIEAEMQKKVEEGGIKESTKNRYYPIYRRCFKENKIGNMDSSELTEEIIQDYIIEAHESFGLNRNDMTFFIGFLQIGINKLSEDGMLDFIPDKKIYKNYIETKQDKNFIYNPYPKEETKKIMEWVEKHLDDVRGLAVALWLLGDISPEEIIKLKKQDLVVSSGNKTDNIRMIRKPNADSYLLLTDERNRLIKAALDLHPSDGLEYIFMVKKENRWIRLNSHSLSIKLYYICRNIGKAVTYRAFHSCDVIEGSDW